SGEGLRMRSQYVAREYASELLSTEMPGIGYLLKDRITEIDGFLRAVRNVAAGVTVIDPAVVRTLLRSPDQRRAVSRLTPRVVEVRDAMTEGLSNRGISERLLRSMSTGEKAVSAMFEKIELLGDEQTSRRVRAVLTYLEEQ